MWYGTYMDNSDENSSARNEPETVIIPPGPIEPADWVELARLALDNLEPYEGVGRPKRIDVTSVTELLAAITRGLHQTTACKLARISYQTYLEWQKLGKSGVPGYVEFLELLEVANAQAEDWHVRNIRRHATSDWKASLITLERRFRARWGKAETIDHRVSGQISHTHSLSITNLPTPADFNYLAELMRQPALPAPTEATEQVIDGEYTEQDE
jgi:hypothetical protein